MPSKAAGLDGWSVELLEALDNSCSSSLSVPVLDIDRDIVDPGPNIVNVGTDAGLANGVSDSQLAEGGSEGTPSDNAFTGIGRRRGDLI